MRLLIVLGLTLVLHACAARACKKKNDPGFDFFILNRQWGPNFCNVDRGCSTKAYEAFTLHGLWPNYEGGGFPQYCNCSNIYSAANLENNITNSMACNWISYKKNNTDFWNHEWEKHGTCSTTVLPSQEEYFDKTLELDEKYDISTALLAAGIDPQSNRRVKKSEITKALTTAFKVAPVLKCGKNNYKNDVLVEIWLCISDEFKVRACPKETAWSTCEDWLSFKSGEKVSPSCRPYLK